MAHYSATYNSKKIERKENAISSFRDFFFYISSVSKWCQSCRRTPDGEKSAEKAFRQGAKPARTKRIYEQKRMLTLILQNSDGFEQHTKWVKIWGKCAILRKLLQREYVCVA